MIKKILKIDNIGRFDNYTPRGDVELAAFTLIFAENSRGKTTLCDVFRSLQSGEGGYVLGRKRLGSIGNPQVDILLANKTAKFRNGAWDALHADIGIFDNTFIHQNVFSGDFVDHDHKRNLYRVIVGEQGVQLAKAVDELDTKIKDATKDLGTKKLLLERAMPAGFSLTDFLALVAEADIEAKISIKEKALADATIASKRSAEIKAKGTLKPISLPVFPTAFTGLLDESLDTISKDAESKIREHLDAHTNGATEEWLAKGFGYIKGSDCPLCGQKIAGLELISAYQSVFDKLYRDLKAKLADFAKSLPIQFSNIMFQSVQKIASENLILVEFWTQFDPMSLSSDFIEEVNLALNTLKICADELLRKKIAAPLEPVPPSPEFDAALAKYASFSASFSAYNDEVKNSNAKIANIKAQAQSADLVKLKKELDALNCNKKRHEAATVTAATEYVAAVALKGQLDKDKTAAKDSLDKYSDTVLKDCEKRINELLPVFGAGFRIGNTKRSYVGARVSSSYHIMINGQPVELGDSATPIQAASFRNTLSAGDKSTLALVFFIVQAERDPNIAQKTLFFDDPFTSQDRSRRTCTQQFLCKLAGMAKQVIVFSHDAYFLRSVWDEVHNVNVKTLQLSRMGNGTGTLLLAWDIENETRGEYAKIHRILWSYYYDATGEPQTVAQSIRPLLEKYLRIKLPNAFGDNEWLGNFIEKIREADATSPLDAAKTILAELEAINDFSKKYHHAQNANADTEPIDDGELQTYVGRTLDLVGGF